jgi:TetR/AcrR family transcriptional repressor of nem operon
MFGPVTTRPRRAPAAPRAPKRGDARVALLDATIGLVRKQGFTATTVDEVCAAAGVTKGAFFHHFASKDALGVAAAERWSEMTAPLFAGADYHRHEDPLDRLLGYLDFRASIARGPIEAFTCFAGTTVQETFASSEPIRAACGRAIVDHAATLAEDFAAAIERHPPRLPVTAEDLGTYTQTVLQGAFVVAKAKKSRVPVLEAIAHLRNYLTLLFQRSR